MKTKNLAARKVCLRKRAVEALRKEDVPPQESLTPDAVMRLLSELRVHQVELEMQNEELRRTQQELEVSWERYFGMYDLAPVGYLTLDEQGQILEANLTAVAMLGTLRGVLDKQLLTRYVLPADRDIFYRQLSQGGKPQPCELRMVREEKGYFWARMETAVDPGREASNPVWRVVLSDISERKQAELALNNAYDELEARVAERTSALELANKQMKRVSFELVWAEEKERERIAGELHDRVGQSLLLAKMKLDALVQKTSSRTLRPYAAEAASLLEGTIHDIRSLTFRMRPPILDTAGIETTLEWLCSSINNDYALRIDFVDDGQPKPLPAEMRYSLYQAVRELLLNVVKHARAEKAQLSVKIVNHTLIVQVTDNGVGFQDPDAQMKHVNDGGYGLYNVEHRIEQIGGSISFESAPGRGTTVTLMVPIDC